MEIGAGRVMMMKCFDLVGDVKALNNNFFDGNGLNVWFCKSKLWIENLQINWN